jgi:polyisoprenyl-phosphate glycosyltransferase
LTCEESSVIQVRQTDTPHLSVVAPAFNEQEGLAAFLDRVTCVCVALRTGYEIIIVDDGSTDGTWPLMRDLAARHDSLTCAKLSRNHGHQLALTAGLSLARGQRILIIDADLQDPPELLPDMLALMDKGADVVYAQRRRRVGETRFKRATASLFYRLIERLADTTIPRDTGDFRLISRRALDVLLAMPERRRFIRGMVSWIGFTQVPIQYDRDARHAGQTHFAVGPMVRFALDAITSFSIRPLLWSATAAALCLALALAALITGLIAYAQGSPIGPWSLLIAVIALLAAVQLGALAILGLYLGRMAEQLRARPLFIIEEVAGPGNAAPRALDFPAIVVAHREHAAR